MSSNWISVLIFEYARNENEKVLKKFLIGDGNMIWLLSCGRKAIVWVESVGFKSEESSISSSKLSSSWSLTDWPELVMTI